MSETAEVTKGRSLRQTPHHGLGCTRHGCHCVCILMCLSTSDVLCIMIKRIDMRQRQEVVVLATQDATHIENDVSRLVITPESQPTREIYIPSVCSHCVVSCIRIV